MGPTPERVLRYTLFFRRNPALSEDEFHQHWSEDHGRQMCVPWLERHGILGYKQYHVSPEMKAMAAPLGGKLLDYDGVVEVIAKSVEQLAAAFLDPEYRKAREKDEDYFVDKSAGGPPDAMFGWEEVFIENGKVVQA